MKRGALAAAIATAIGGHDTAVVCSLGSTSRAWRGIGAPTPTFYGSDPMGLAASTALGLAIARAPRRVLFLAGDGDLLMSLTALVAMAGVAGAAGAADAADISLGIVVFANGRYETGGGQPLAGGPTTDLAQLARGAGVRVVPGLDDTADTVDPADVAACVDALFAAPGVALCVASVEPEASPYGGPGASSGAEDRQRFRDELARHDEPTGHDEGPEVRT